MCFRAAHSPNGILPFSQRSVDTNRSDVGRNARGRAVDGSLPACRIVEKSHCTFLKLTVPSLSVMVSVSPSMVIFSR